MLEQTLKHNIQLIKENIVVATQTSHREFDSVNLVCVSKSVDIATTQQVVDLGLTQLAENRVENLLEKKQLLTNSDQITWHFIGNLQRRKVKQIINEIDYFHALDSLKLAAEIDKRATKIINCFVQVNVSGEETKQGISPNDLIQFTHSLVEYKKVKVVGLMTMAPFNSSDSELRNIFSELNELKETIAAENLENIPCTELSMGMSEDYQIAIEEGATFVRVGSSFFHNEQEEVEER